MKTIKLASMAAAVSMLSACSGMPMNLDQTGQDITTGFFGADPDYTVYTSACSKEVLAKQEIRTSDLSALTQALTATTDAMTKGSLIVMAAFKISQPESLDCSIKRKIGFVEGLGTSGILGLGMDLYRENRADSRFQRQLSFDAKKLELQLQDSASARDANTSLFRDLVGTYGQRAASAAAAAAVAE